MTTNQDRPYHAASLVDGDEVWLRLYRTISTPGAYLTMTDDVSAVSVSFSLNWLSLARLITALQHESELLSAPTAGERRRAPSDHPELSGCEVIRADDARSGPLVGAHARRWFVYRGSAVGAWTTDAEVADWTVLS